MRWVVSAWVSITIADAWTASGSVFLLTDCAPSARVAANRRSAAEIFMGSLPEWYSKTAGKPQIPPLRYAPVGMTKRELMMMEYLLSPRMKEAGASVQRTSPLSLSSRPERSEVEGSAVRRRPKAYSRAVVLPNFDPVLHSVKGLMVGGRSSRRWTLARR